MPQWVWQDLSQLSAPDLSALRVRLNERLKALENVLAPLLAAADDTGEWDSAYWDMGDWPIEPVVADAVDRIEALEAADGVLDGRIDVVEADVVALEAADVTLAADIAALDARVLDGVGDAANGDTSPSVDGLRYLRTANAGATSITAFDDGEPGQVLAVEFNDANTTLVDSATLVLAGGADFTGAVGDMKWFATRDGAVFREIPTPVWA